MHTENDKRIVLTLDAGGTNFVFSAIQGNKEVAGPVGLPSNAHDLDKCLDTIIDGFRQVRSELSDAPSAISFAFPGPADYPKGIIFDLQNLPAFRGGVALGPMLESIFDVPVFINNDGDLYAYGEALAGYLPYVNGLLQDAGSPKRYKNLFGITLGTGFGGGLVTDGRLYLGDNSAASEVWLLRNKLDPATYAEEGVSIRGAQRIYAELCNITQDEAPTPKEIFDIGMGRLEGNREAAREAYSLLGEVLGDAIASILNIADSIVVIGGGISGARELIIPSLMRELNGHYTNKKGEKYSRIVQQAFNLEDEQELKVFLTGDSKTVTVPRTDIHIDYDPMSRTGIGFSKIGTSKAIALGAYAFALYSLNQNV
jgi:glucokinase